MSNLFGIDIQFQKDKMLVMESPQWQEKPDYIYQFGCLLCASLNATNHFNFTTKSDKSFMTIEELNNKMIENNGYNYLYWLDYYKGDIEKTKAACFNKEAYSLPGVLDNILGIKQRIGNYQDKIDMNVVNEYYLLHTNFMNTKEGHWSWLIKDDGQTVVDSYDGIIRKYSKDKIMDITKIVF